MYVLTLLTVSRSELKASAKCLNCKFDFTQLKLTDCALTNIEKCNIGASDLFEKVSFLFKH